MGVHKKLQKQENIDREQLKQYHEFWSDNQKAIPILEKEFPDVPKAILELNLRLYNKLRKLDKNEKKKYLDEINNFPEHPNPIKDFKNGDDVYEDGIKIYQTEYKEQEPIPAEAKGEIVSEPIKEEDEGLLNSCEIL